MSRTAHQLLSAATSIKRTCLSGQQPQCSSVCSNDGSAPPLVRFDTAASTPQCHCVLLSVCGVKRPATSVAVAYTVPWPSILRPRLQHPLRPREKIAVPSVVPRHFFFNLVLGMLINLPQSLSTQWNMRRRSSIVAGASVPLMRVSSTAMASSTSSVTVAGHASMIGSGVRQLSSVIVGGRC